MNTLDSLIARFQKFPGIGGRQARRFAFHVLTMDQNDVSELAKLITELKSSVVECRSCHRFFSNTGGNQIECGICSDVNRDRSKLLVVERDSDVQSIERSRAFDGLYFVLGGTAPLLNIEDTNKLRGPALKATVEERKSQGLCEIVLGLSVNPDGENTGRYVESLLKDFIDDTLAISYLGRGLSTGSELEYADADTIKSALKNRT